MEQALSGRCIFCDMNQELFAASNELAFAIRDTTPVTPLHTLILPKRHAATYFDLEPSEVLAIHELAHVVREDIERQDNSVHGLTLGFNIGELAGQTIFHCHLHLIPRRAGDHPDPRGGVRAIIPGKAKY